MGGHRDYFHKLRLFMPKSEKNVIGEEVKTGETEIEGTAQRLELLLGVSYS